MISAGLRHLAALLKDPRYSEIENVSSLISVAGEVLRLLTSITKSLRDTEQTVPDLESPGNLTHDGLFAEVLKKLKAVMDVLKTSHSILDIGNVSRLTMFLARILHFVLALPSTWTTQFRDLVNEFSEILTALIIVSDAFPRLSDFT